MQKLRWQRGGRVILSQPQLKRFRTTRRTMYPKTKYHPEKPPVTVTNMVEEAMLGDEWKDVPADSPEPEKRGKPKKVA